MPKLFLCLHAESVANKEGWVSGWDDVALTDNGLIQAQKLAEALEQEDAVGGILTSDLSRASKTAETLRDHLGLEMVVDEGLRERNYGEWTGTSYNDAFIVNKDQWERLREEENFAPPGGETLEDHRRRVIDALGRGRERWPEGFIVVTHRAVLLLIVKTLGIWWNGTSPTPLSPPTYMRLEWHLQDSTGEKE